MRFNNFLFNKVSKICSRSKHKFPEKLLEEVNNYDTASITERSKLLNKVSVLMGYNGLHDLFENERPDEQPDRNLRDATDDFDLSLACKRFPSITLGSSPRVELYDEATSSSRIRALLEAQGFLSNSMDEKWVDPNDLSETWPSFYQPLPETGSSVVVEESSDLYQSSCSATLESEGKSDHPLTVEEDKEELDQSSWSMTLGFEGKSNHLITEEESSSKVGIQPQLDMTTFDFFLDRSVSCIPGLSKRQSHQLEECGFFTLRKLLHHFPRTYADLQNAQTEINDGQYLIFVGKIMSSRGIRASYSFSFLEVIVGCEVANSEPISDNIYGDTTDTKGEKTIYLHLKKFFRGARFASQPFLRCLEGKHKVGELVCVSGKVRALSKDHHEMREYSIDVLKDENDSSVSTKGRPYPIYPSKGGLKPDFLRDIIARALQAVQENIDPIPNEIINEFGLLRLHDAYVGIHQPMNIKEADLARKRLIFDEFFYLQLGRLFQMLDGLGTQIEKDGLLEKYRKPEANAAYMEEWSSLTKEFFKALPYSLTSGQLSAISEIIWDLKRPVPMNRLLQGDVGCGKTVVAFLACMEVIASGYQAAFMVPTELLAIQHYEHFVNLLEKMDVVDNKPSVALLTGSTPQKQSRLIRKDLQSGDISLVIGTHSLIAEKVEFSSLRIAVVDEQHRFGVIQRGKFNSKLYHTSSSRTQSAEIDVSSEHDTYMAPHILALSATPIPRTLALALYGDVSLTNITDLPPGRIPVETYIIEGTDNGFKSIYKMMLEELEAGGRLYLVYPVIEQSEQLPQLRAASADLEIISKQFPDYKCGLLHGRMKGDEKEETLREFRSGGTDILLSTQVIEIGVDVPDASMMVVMNAERFGIAQLHQLRGRVGRGTRKSKCILVASTSSGLGRLKMLEKSSDGFHLASVDLLLRGPGDLLGKKQSGHLPEFPIARLEMDGNILQEAHVAALKILSDSHDLERFPALKAELSMRQPLCILGD
ncbi:ATP-dependent DNA helicase homolog RECG, chloroplastic-like isoform X2 [Hibiscus syriacus]|nr:ATP-dependent DNA helicase homolog RECG, chloroplastic-like isoform X2 [Hibiscus syriacus]